MDRYILDGSILRDTQTGEEINLSTPLGLSEILTKVLQELEKIQSKINKL